MSIPALISSAAGLATGQGMGALSGLGGVAGAAGDFAKGGLGGLGGQGGIAGALGGMAQPGASFSIEDILKSINAPQEGGGQGGGQPGGQAPGGVPPQMAAAPFPQARGVGGDMINPQMIAQLAQSNRFGV